MIYNNINYENYNPIELRRKVSYSTQHLQLFGEKVWENIDYPFKIRKVDTDSHRVEELLKKFNLDLSILDKDVVSLSGGEKQRTSIIRNLVISPDVILLDEDTSALDSENTKLVENYNRELNENGKLKKIEVLKNE